MPKRKITPAEEPEQTTGLMGQAGEEPPVPSGEPPQDTGALDGPLPISGDNPGPPEDGEGVAGEVMAVDVSTAPVPLDSGPEEAPPHGAARHRAGGRAAFGHAGTGTRW